MPLHAAEMKNSKSKKSTQYISKSTSSPKEAEPQRKFMMLVEVGQV
jgi:hypothetical protein